MRGMPASKKLKSLPVVFLLILLANSLTAQESLDLPALIGLTLEEAFQNLGAPAQVYAVRGSQEGQDDVVFYYANHLYLFWFQNRVWQVRSDRRFAGEVFSLTMGASPQQVTRIMGRPLKEFEDSLVFHIEDRGYPVQARFYFEDGALNDVYCYRGDL
jgi:hypothetical protein